MPSFREDKKTVEWICDNTDEEFGIKILQRTVKRISKRISGRRCGAVLTKKELCSVARAALQSPDTVVALCQSVTRDGKLCSRNATTALSLDLRNAADKLPVSIFGKDLKQKLIEFSDRCCFFCWQHAVTTLIYYSTYTIPSYVQYYSVHLGEFMDIFFEEVDMTILDDQNMNIKPRYEIGRIRTASEIVERISYLVQGAGQSVILADLSKSAYNQEVYDKFKFYVWGLITLVFYLQFINKFIKHIIPTQKINEAVKVAATVLTHYEIFSNPEKETCGLFELPPPPHLK